ncbi:MAG: tRNA isopentenyl-2-thiomethyl-A-37 hydroxylase MiaE [Polyangiales bacterium]
MLGLLTPTDPRWVEAAEANLPELLSDHAHCELKAAVSALSLVSRFGAAYPALIEPLSALAQEETEHFRAVQGELVRRETSLGRSDPDAYVNALWDLTKPERARVHVLLDRLLVNALIEARSCERFKLLSEQLSDAGLRAFYRDLMASEARHFRLFCGLSEELFGVKLARDRLSELSRREAGVASRLQLGPRVHG